MLPKESLAEMQIVVTLKTKLKEETFNIATVEASAEMVDKCMPSIVDSLKAKLGT